MRDAILVRQLEPLPIPADVSNLCVQLELQLQPGGVVTEIANLPGEKPQLTYCVAGLFRGEIFLQIAGICVPGGGGGYFTNKHFADCIFVL